MISYLFLGNDPSDPTIKWSEDKIQMYIVQEARRAGYDVVASMEQGSRSKSAGGRAKAMGMVSGEPDLRFYLPFGKIVMIELKNGTGKLSETQKARHKLLTRNGHIVKTVKAKTPYEAWLMVQEILLLGGM